MSRQHKLNHLDAKLPVPLWDAAPSLLFDLAKQDAANVRDIYVDGSLRKSQVATKCKTAKLEDVPTDAVLTTTGQSPSAYYQKLLTTESVATQKSSSTKLRF